MEVAFHSAKYFCAIEYCFASYRKSLNMTPKLTFLALACMLALACGPSKNSTSSTQKTEKPGAYQMLKDDTYRLTGISEDDTYGYSQNNAIRVGTSNSIEGPSSERKYLNALLGPNGEAVSYNRRGSCCQVKSDNGIMGYATLDIYEIKYNDQHQPIKLYLNMYDPGVLKAPKGFTFKQ
jgi:hypothetical protein